MGRIEQHFEANKADTGSELRVDKCEIFDLLKVKNGETCIDTLGACIGSKDHRVTFLQAKIDELERAILRLKQLPKQHGLLLLRSSISKKLAHLLRCMNLTDMTTQLATIDNIIYSTVDHMRDLPASEERTALQTTIMCLPLKKGGIGLSSYVKVRPAARTNSSIENSQHCRKWRTFISNWKQKVYRTCLTNTMQLAPCQLYWRRKQLVPRKNS